MLCKRLPVVGSISDAEMPHKCRRKPALCDILLSRRTFSELREKKLRRLAVHGKYPLAVHSPGLTRAVVGKLYSGALCKIPESIHVVKVLRPHDEADDIAPRPASEAVKRPRPGENGERRRPFAVERTQPDKIRPRAFERHIAGNNILDVVSVLEFFNYLRRDQILSHPFAQPLHGSGIKSCL